MLELKNITKDYVIGDFKVKALKGIDIKFRKNEFVCILGPSGCGKTTLLNIIGGLDKYTSGDLVIDNKSTKQFTDRDWDTYRNHRVGFVFQNYNLIPHQTVLSNVELALTLSGVSKQERKKRAVEALEKVGLGDQIYKKPNQMSGGQMQRVAIARALVNNPDIILADEPTGALDSETSKQIMELLKEISKDKLIVMVTHNADIADSYATRIVRLLDGHVVSDSDPYKGSTIEIGETVKEKKRKKESKKKTSMSFFTALSLSLNNLLTKKTRTFLTSFAGSIGIIGIALIMAVSTGVQSYIDMVQRDTLSSYPITLESEFMELSALLETISKKNDDDKEHELDAVYPNPVMAELVNKLNTAETRKNNLKAFKKYLEENANNLDFLSSIQYMYDLNLNIYSKDVEGKIFKSDIQELMNRFMGGGSSQNRYSSPFSSSFNVWQEIMPGKNGETIADTVYEQYDVIYGKMPENHDEIVLIVDEKNEISDMVLFSLGFITEEQMMKIMMAGAEGKTVELDLRDSWSYEEICEMTFKVVLNADKYQKQDNGRYVDLSETEAGLAFLYDNASVDLKVVGILRPKEDAVATSISGGIGYTSKLTEFVINETSSREIVKEQLANPDIDVITGLPFKNEEAEELTEEEKIIKVNEYFAALDNMEKAALYIKIMSVPSSEYLESAVTQTLRSMSEEEIKQMLVKAYAEQMGLDEEQIAAYVENMDKETRTEYASQILAASISMEYAKQVQQELGALPSEQLVYLFDNAQFTKEQYLYVFENLMPATESESTLEDNLKLLGYVDLEDPFIINLYATTFENKQLIADMIKKYNRGVSENDKISYVDYIELFMSSITTIISAISYVLMAFVAISLIVSSIMIGIITYISVLERTKEIGILRAIGASKKDISRVFNAETLIVGFVAGALGILITLFLIVIVNIILLNLTGIEALRATLPIGGAIVLVLISMFLTLIAGLIPSKIASKKDPVIALRTE
jgi:putative ABC transport system permease protein